LSSGIVTNLGGGTPIWDWVFGTMYLPDPEEIYALGLNEHEIGENNPHNTFSGYIIGPVIEFTHELSRLIGKAARPTIVGARTMAEPASSSSQTVV
jgi:hypothetical protein